MGFFDRITDGFKKSPPSALPKETPFIQEYEHVKDLLPGAMSTISQVRHRVSKRLFCVKKVKPQNEAQRKSLERELEVSFLMQHENIGKTLAWQRMQGETWVLMEWIEGSSLRMFMRDQFVTRGAKAPLLTGRDFMTVYLKAARALQFVHGKNWLHLDVKPENFLVNGLRPVAETKTDRAKDTQIFRKEVLEQAGGITVKLIDFGISVRIDEPKVGLGGSPLYVSPEVVGGAQTQSQVGPAADIWSLGATMYELASGRPPYLPQWFDNRKEHWQAIWGEYERQDPGIKRTYDQDMVKKRLSTPADMARVVYSDAIKMIIRKSLELPFNRRYTSAAALVSELEKFV
ncbi:MAG: protein kinase [Candidatus Brocadiae bacterium]|nr:protein kinase [Candidatus Brocadiia bacterium]